MKFIFTILLSLFVLMPTFSQQDGVIDDPGDIAFVAYSDGQDGFSFLFLDDCPANTVIQFTDKEWVNANNAFDSASEGVIEWTNNTGAIIEKGTVVDITINGSSLDPGESTGNAIMAENGVSTSGTNDAIYAVIGGTISGGNLINPTVFLSLVDVGAGVSTTGTGLTVGTNAISIAGEGYYMASTDCNSSLSACLTMINTAANWTSGLNYSFPTAVPNSFAGSLLPVELISFNGKANGNFIEIQWTTATEVNNDYMSIERSNDGRIFEEIGRMEGAGTTSKVQSYSLIDKNPLVGLNYYRLRQVDYEGREAVHQVISVFMDKGQEVVQLYPNPASDRVQLKFQEPALSEGVVRLIDINGRMVQEWVVNSQETHLEFSVNNLEKGIYLIQFESGNYFENHRFVKN